MKVRTLCYPRATISQGQAMCCEHLPALSAPWMPPPPALVCMQIPGSLSWWRGCPPRWAAPPLPAQSSSIFTALGWVFVYRQGPKAARWGVLFPKDDSSKTLCLGCLEGDRPTVTSSRDQSEGWRDQPDQFKPGVPTAHATAIPASFL